MAWCNIDKGRSCLSEGRAGLELEISRGKEESCSPEQSQPGSVTSCLPYHYRDTRSKNPNLGAKEMLGPSPDLAQTGTHTLLIALN